MCSKKITDTIRITITCILCREILHYKMPFSEEVAHLFHRGWITTYYKVRQSCVWNSALCKFKCQGWEFLLCPERKSLPLARHLLLHPFWASAFFRIVIRTLLFGNHYNFLEMVVLGTLLYDPLCLKVELLLDLIGNVFNKMGAQKIGKQHNPFWKYMKINGDD